MGLNSTKNTQSNMTWGLTVDSGFNYLVRFHFCEIYRNVNYTGESRFLIYIDHSLAEENADVLLWTDERETTIYKDYVVMIRKKGLDGEKQHILSIDLECSNMCDNTRVV